MSASWATLLTALYGPAKAGALSAKLLAIIESWRPHLASRRHTQAAPLTQRDVVLITYAAFPSPG